MTHPRYGWEHQQARAAWARRIKAGESILCSRCYQPVTARDTWHLDHADDGVSYLGPAHAYCNQRAGGIKGQQVLRATTRRPRTMPTSREW